VSLPIIVLKSENKPQFRTILVYYVINNNK